MLIELWLENLPASLRLRTHLAIRRPEAENDSGDRRVEQRHPEAVFFTAQFFREISDFARVRKLSRPGCRRLLCAAHTRCHSPHRPNPSTFRVTDSDATARSGAPLRRSPRAPFILRVQRKFTKYSRAQCFCGFDEILVQGGEWQFPALREFQIGGVVHAEPVAFSQSGRRGPGLVSGLSIQSDGQCAQKASQTLPATGVNSPSAPSEARSRPREAKE